MNELNPIEHACLLLIKSGMRTIPKEVLDKNIKSKLLFLELIELIDDREWSLTKKGNKVLQENIIIKYPAHNKGNIGTYDQVIKTMSDSAIDAFICSAMNNRMFDRINKKTARTLGQHLLDISFHKKFGSVLIKKWFHQMKSSLDFFKKLSNKYKK